METTICPIRTFAAYRCPALAASVDTARTESRARVFVSEAVCVIVYASVRLYIVQ